MEAQLEQHGPLKLGERIGVVDPNPLTDDLCKAPLTEDAAANEAKDLAEREGPKLLVERATELARRQGNGEGGLRQNLRWR